MNDPSYLHPPHPGAPEKPATSRFTHPPTPSRARHRLTVFLPASLLERLRNAVYWTEQRTLARIIVDAVEDAVTELEQANGGPFPARLAPLKPGRPRRRGAPAPVQPGRLSTDPHS